MPYRITRSWLKPCTFVNSKCGSQSASQQGTPGCQTASVEQGRAHVWTPLALALATAGAARASSQDR